MSGIAPERANRLTYLKCKSLLVAAWASMSINCKVTHAPHTNVRVHVPRVIVAIDGTATAMHAVVPIAAANEGVQGSESSVNWPGAY